MVSSILQESRVSVADVEAELQALDSPKRTTAQNLLILLGTLLLFVLIGVVDRGPMGVLVLVVVVLLHELGHLLAMKAFGYRDVQMFFIPLFGAAVSGAEATPSGARRAIVAISGPAPGIVLGILCLVLWRRTGGAVLADFARVFLALNTLNLLPIVPLDGGRYIEAVVFARAPLLRAAFSGAAGIALEVVALKFLDPFVGFIGLVVLSSIRLDYLSGRLANQIKRELAAQDAAHATDRDRVPSACIERMIPLLELRLPEALQTAAGIARAIRNIWSMVWFTPPGVLASIGLLVLYLSCLGVGVIATGVAETAHNRVAIESMPTDSRTR